ncbi:MAG: C39 family peptidase [bacterium]|nr:C39 family peptidase [bacterium]
MHTKKKHILSLCLAMGIFVFPLPFFFSQKKETTAKEILTSIQPKKKIEIKNVPFTSQAPFSNWEDPRQQNGCEEASILMALKWVKNEPLDRNIAEKEIIAISEFEKEKYGFYEDSSAEQTAIIMKDYFGYASAVVKKNISKTDVIAALETGAIVIVPVQGKKLKNPNFKGAGPERHMLVIYGYDPRKKEFITNDPGTRKGKGYRYKENILLGAILNYPNGFHEPITKKETAMIIVKK